MGRSANRKAGTSTRVRTQARCDVGTEGGAREDAAKRPEETSRSADPGISIVRGGGSRNPSGFLRCAPTGTGQTQATREYSRQLPSRRRRLAVERTKALEDRQTNERTTERRKHPPTIPLPRPSGNPFFAPRTKHPANAYIIHLSILRQKKQKKEIVNQRTWPGGGRRSRRGPAGAGWMP